MRRLSAALRPPARLGLRTRSSTGTTTPASSSSAPKILPPAPYLGTRSTTLSRASIEELARENAPIALTVAGWIVSRKKYRNAEFYKLRDSFGSVQLNFTSPCELTVREEDVVQVKGRVVLPVAQPPRHIEIEVDEIQLLNAAQQPLPFSLQNQEEETLKGQSAQRRELGLKHRYLELRRAELQRNLRLRGRTLHAMRRFMCEEAGFLEVDTPTLFKSTPEGAREFLVPTRPTSSSPSTTWYALAQSPQQLKQMLMVGGIDRYFQIAKCYRDEGGRADRQPEFTQLDLEMSFVREGGDVMRVVEGAVRAGWPRELPHLPALPENQEFPRLTLKEALERFGSDKPDRSFGLEIESAGSDELQLRDSATSLSKLLSLGELRRAVQDVPGVRVSKDHRVYILTSEKSARAKLGLARLRVRDVCRAKQLELPPGDLKRFTPYWVVDFPMFERDEVTGVITACHHAFTSPVPRDFEAFKRALQESAHEQLLTIYADHYDLVCDGVELGGGSVRLHDAGLQRQVFTNVLGMSESECDVKFGHLLAALQTGAPPHAGFAFGFDRFVATMCGTDSIAQVIAFPKSQGGADPLSGAPSVVDPAVLRELGLALTNETKQD